MIADATNSAYEALIQFLYQAPIGLVQATLDGEITMINPMAAQLLMPLVPDGNLVNFFGAFETVAPQLRQLAGQAIADGDVVCDGLRVPLPTATQHNVASDKTLSIRLVRLDRNTLIASVSDATQSVQSEKQRLAIELRDVTRIDPLTGLPNRVVAMERIAAALANVRDTPGAMCAVLCVDCDRFEQVNVTLGSQAGDELLRLVGGRLNGIIRLGDQHSPAESATPAAARIGGDQFVLVLQGLREAADVRAVAQRVVDTLANPFVLGDRLVHITASVGLVCGAQAVGNPDDVLVNASIAVHEAKRAGGARYMIFDPALKDRAALRGTTETDLRSAIADQQLFVVYQPIINMVGGRCIAVEALVRWHHPLRGVVSPVDFIGIAEETGQIDALGAFVLNQSCTQLAAWQRQLGALAPHTICVNLSRAQLLGQSFPATVQAALDNSGLHARHLQLEITESLAAQDGLVIAQLQALKALGLTLALDDFGTGYSSLSSLHELPVDVVKIDRSFVSQVDTSAHHRVLIEATVMVAKSLGMSTVAEGIETAGQLAVLQQLRCDKGQGYLLSKPMTDTAFADWLQRQAPRH